MQGSSSRPGLLQEANHGLSAAQASRIFEISSMILRRAPSQAHVIAITYPYDGSPVTFSRPQREQDR